MVTAAVAVAVFGLANFLVFDTVASRVVRQEVQERAATLSRRLAVESSRLILLEDRAALHRLLDSTRQTDQLCDYALVLGPGGDVLASTFTHGVPRGLATISPSGVAGAGTAIVSDRGTRFLDVAAPILDGQLGTVRVGSRMEHIHAGAAQVRAAGATMVATFLLLGLLGAYFTAHLIAAPVERLAARARAFDPTSARGLPPVDPNDASDGEIGELVRSFELMSKRLREVHREERAFQTRIVRAERLATVGALAAGVAHDVNNPLAGILNCLRAMDRAPEDTEQTRTYTPMMIEATRSIERTVKSLMDTASRATPMPELVPVGRLSERTALLVRHCYEDRGCELVVRTERDAKDLETDAALLQQVLVNLLINACDASRPGGVVTLSVASDELGARITVEDRGSGIAPDVAEHIFEPFVTTKERRGGTGLGLAMVRSIVSELGGDVEFTTALGKGTCFTVVLPPWVGEVSGLARAAAFSKTRAGASEL